MKTALTSILTATILGFASFAGAHSFDAADFTAILFAAGLVAWTMAQYDRRPRLLGLTRPIHLPVGLGARPPQASDCRLAA